MHGAKVENVLHRPILPSKRGREAKTLQSDGVISPVALYGTGNPKNEQEHNALDCL